METITETPLRLSPHYVFRWEASQDAHILLYPEGLIKLNPAAAEILKRCDGERTATAIIADLNASFPGQPEAIARDTLAFLSAAQDKGWLRPS
ncbi:MULTISPECIES: pyrroloquinoline quinone biosynthesis peptide chaperone PqqD [Comamonadaceae]|jgi:pyrroloquinoline quinone biosynthesis protein D|uniref:pyrroloquinoline quinone biosynthesis peptide chaperone PqqD n=1 Tax=Comamonadaceae TaxID=80864 RepID=UPI000BD8CCBA|nr:MULTISPECIES: pyrroloquinoline quinone biosynthesis peptide chaperone PqqD [Comamonadaceae]OZA57511.1 MAG: pyrroloquinoline quinone biosynthesis protein PqqD [Acidovorax sp. 17-64-282]HQT19460.1 pyrroloquinoline quinone biosynthesis peptide chaperone PqqD [Acidovorax defluvii]OYY25914.1 MAG: pyrroloquinoline quinone biosynthesis protein PqqD [Acidovorax sp. 35-64-16]OYY85140.1 MAG: pyrroloquinoline quinone biosynthesis protein PqqD [Acidovorax sp. 28-64-14]OZA67279.1 MAG: pyrroloquinoline q